MPNIKVVWDNGEFEINSKKPIRVFVEKEIETLEHEPNTEVYVVDPHGLVATPGVKS